MTQEPSFLTVRQAADRLNEAGLSISKDTVQRWCREQQITATRLPGGHYRIPIETVEGLLVTRPAEQPAGAA